MSLTRQEVLTRIYRHFIEDAAPRCAFDGKCRYSPTDEPGSVGCAIGCLLPPEVDISFYTDLQYWHDRNIKRCASVSDRLAYLAHIAITYDLTLPTEGDPA